MRSQKQNPDEIDGSLQAPGNCISSVVSGGDLDLLANVTCPEEQHNGQRAVEEQAGQIMSHENHLTQQAVTIPEQQQEMDQTVVEQEGQIVTHASHLAGQTVAVEQQVVHLQQQDVPLDVAQDVPQTIPLHQSNNLCEQHVQVGELVQQDGDYV